MDLTGITAIVTGGASGLGLATAAKFADRGARVVAIDLPAQIASASPPTSAVVFVPGDVTNPDQVQDAVAVAAGESAMPLRVVVNCAGIAPSARILSRRGRHDTTLFARVVEVNLVGSFTVLAAASEAIAETPALQDGQRGVVINTASVAAFEGQVGQVAYAASKAGIAGMTLPAARDLAQYGIRVNTIAPGILTTPMLATVGEAYREGLAAGVPFPARLGRPDEYADLAVFLVEHDYINGETVRLDGALRMAPR